MRVFILLALILLAIIITAYGEREPWDCPDCGRKENKGNYCGECGHPAPWTDPDAWKDYALDGEAKRAAFRNVGGYVTFGSYEQDNNIENGKEPIEWLVLDYDAKNNRTLLLSRYALEKMPFHNVLERMTWEQCSLRTWLNGAFLSNAFTVQEQAGILTTTVSNSKEQAYSEWSTSDGNNTQDKAFLLSYAEANEYLDVMVSGNGKNMKSRVAPTTSAIKQGVLPNTSLKTIDGSQAVEWWLRSPGIDQYGTASVGAGGSLSFSLALDERLYVRPALWIDLGSDVFSTTPIIATTTYLTPTSSPILMPVIIKQPQTVNAYAEEKVVFHAEVKEATTFQWQFYNENDWKNVPSVSGWSKAESPESLTVIASEVRKDYKYRLAVTNSYGTVYSDEVRVTMIHDAPAFIVQPQSIIAEQGEQVVLQAEVIGALRYQWQFSQGGNRWINILSGGSNCLYLTADKSIQNCKYRLEVQNSYGTAYSNEVTVTLVEATDKPSQTP